MAAESPSIVGARSELAVATGLLRAGYDVFTPFFSAHGRVDLVAIGVNGLQRLQVKTARVRQGALLFRTCSYTGKVHADYRGEIDAFGVFSPDLGLIYLVPIDVVPMREAALRVDRSRNNQVAGIRWAADYVIGPP